MSTNSHIEWTDATWNPITGCDKISSGCKNCYAERMAHRLKAMGQDNYRNGFDVTLQPNMIERPLGWKKPQRIFVNSMSDLFHKDVPEYFIREVFDVMGRAHWHQFQVLTKRSERLRELAPTLPWTPNIWMGVSIESPKYLYRADDLRLVPAVVRFLSLEPLLESLPGLDVTGIDWVIVGGESGPKSRPMEEDWVQKILSICHSSAVPYLFKQWGGVSRRKTGRALNGQTYDGYPTVDIDKFRERMFNLCGNGRSGQPRKSASVCGEVESQEIIRTITQ
jgi:protein gp37